MNQPYIREKEGKTVREMSMCTYDAWGRINRAKTRGSNKKGRAESVAGPFGNRLGVISEPSRRCVHFNVVWEPLRSRRGSESFSCPGLLKPYFKRILAMEKNTTKHTICFRTSRTQYKPSVQQTIPARNIYVSSMQIRAGDKLLRCPSKTTCESS